MEFSENALRNPITRRALLRRASMGAAGVTLGPGLLAACGSSSSPSANNAAAAAVRGKTIRMINYVDWIGAKEAQDFQQQTGTTIQQVVVNSDQTRVSKLAADPTSADMTLGDLSDAGRLAGLGLLAKLDLAKIPNYKNVQSFAKVGDFSPSVANGIPVDFGRDGFVYRTDLVKENITSWADFYRVAPKYSGKITMIDIEEDTLSTALIALGHDVNTTNPAEIEKAGKLLISIKPHLQALVTTNFIPPLIKGSVWIAMDYDYDAGAAIQANPKVPMKWVDPADGTRAYLDGWEAINTTKVLPEIEEWMNFHLDPKNYATFVNATATSPAMLPGCLPYVNASIRNDPVLNPDKSVTDRIVFDRAHGESQKYRDQAWANFKAA
jgi:spermidine/putrescine-binding protein